MKLFPNLLIFFVFLSSCEKRILSENSFVKELINNSNCKNCAVIIIPLEGCRSCIDDVIANSLKIEHHNFYVCLVTSEKQSDVRGNWFYDTCNFSINNNLINFFPNVYISNAKGDFNKKIEFENNDINNVFEEINYYLRL
jgi:hypothetical protein